MALMFLRTLALFAALGWATSGAGAENFSGRVVGVSDGDTISVMRDGRAVKVRLEGIDCPEGGQDFGQRAKQQTSALVFGKDVLVEVRDHDRYGRTVGRVYVGGNDVSLTLVQAGMAWHYKAYSSEATLAVAEEQARSAKRGLWGDPGAIPPWEYRATPKALAVSTPFVGNVSSHVVHSSTCRHAGCKNCKKGFNDLDVAVAAGPERFRGRLRRRASPRCRAAWRRLLRSGPAYRAGNNRSRQSLCHGYRSVFRGAQSAHRTGRAGAERPSHEVRNVA